MVALLGAGALVALSGLEPRQYLEEVEWPTLVFFMGLFVMVGALVEVGIVEPRLGEVVADAVGDRYLLATTALLWGSGLLSGIIDNIPYVATMTPLVQNLVDAGGGSEQARALWWALALGADLGGNATAVGATPTSSSSASPPATGTRSRSGSSPGTAPWSPWSPSR